MPTFDDTWIFPDTAVLNFNTEAHHNNFENSTSSSHLCSLCSDVLVIDENPRIRFPCSNLSCPNCTWLWRNSGSCCQKCVARLTCPSTSPLLDVDKQMISSPRAEVPDDMYDGDDERGAFPDDRSTTFRPIRLTKGKRENPFSAVIESRKRGTRVNDQRLLKANTLKRQSAEQKKKVRQRRRFLKQCVE
ncbi:hypothetical protein BDR22DRAFT_398259 [Usnea florida]